MTSVTSPAGRFTPVRRLSALLAASFAACAFGICGLASSASAAWSPGGQLLHLVPHLGVNTTSTSDNWFGYNQGALANGDQLFHSITAEWTVPTATQHTSAQAEDSADWIGIGGGCVDSGCDVSDETLIQTGTEQDVSSSGGTSYDAWYELVPAPEIETSMTIHPGDLMSASISQVVTYSDVWTITLDDLTDGQSFTTTVPYPSTQDTAEWIEETPLEIGTDAGLASLPNLTSPDWQDATVNGANADLQTSQEIDLVNSSGDVIGVPSAPGPENNSFNECTWTTTCTAP
jgi:Peptidase A4 family